MRPTDQGKTWKTTEKKYAKSEATPTAIASQNHATSSTSRDYPSDRGRSRSVISSPLDGRGFRELRDVVQPPPIEEVAVIQVHELLESEREPGRFAFTQARDAAVAKGHLVATQLPDTLADASRRLHGQPRGSWPSPASSARPADRSRQRFGGARNRDQDSALDHASHESAATPRRGWRARARTMVRRFRLRHPPCHRRRPSRVRSPPRARLLDPSTQRPAEARARADVRPAPSAWRWPATVPGAARSRSRHSWRSSRPAGRIPSRR